MAAGGAGHADSCSENDAASSQPLTEEETTTATAKRLRFTTLTPTTLQQPTPKPPSLPSALPSNHQPRMPPPPATIPFELIAEILARLPVKSLLRFRCVCKSWNALISDPQFAKKQFRASAMGLGPTHSARHHLIVSSFDPWHGSLLTDYSLHSVLNSSSATSSRRKWPYVEGEYFRYLAGSCHGMLCIAIGRSCPLLWNPSTGKFKILPSLTKYWQKPGFVAYGFGYDHFGDSYKVVAVVLVLAGGHHVLETEVKVHTLGTDSWRAIHGFPARVASGSGKFVSGTVNWLASDITRSWVIASLDLRTETFQQLLPPDYGADVKVSFNLAALKGCLGIIAHCNMVSDIWLMKDYGNKESWTKLFCFPYLEEHPKYHPRFTRVLYISDEDDEILLEYRSNFTVYNSKSGTFKTPRVQKFRAPIVAEVYAESLISPCC